MLSLISRLTGDDEDKHLNPLLEINLFDTNCDIILCGNLEVETHVTLKPFCLTYTKYQCNQFKNNT